MRIPKALDLCNGWKALLALGSPGHLCHQSALGAPKGSLPLPYTLYKKYFSDKKMLLLLLLFFPRTLSYANRSESTASNLAAEPPISTRLERKCMLRFTLIPPEVQGPNFRAVCTNGEGATLSRKGMASLCDRGLR